MAAWRVCRNVWAIYDRIDAAMAPRKDLNDPPTAVGGIATKFHQRIASLLSRRQ
jgi:hypothetical protein